MKGNFLLKYYGRLIEHRSAAGLANLLVILIFNDFKKHKFAINGLTFYVIILILSLTEFCSRLYSFIPISDANDCSQSQSV